MVTTTCRMVYDKKTTLIKIETQLMHLEIFLIECIISQYFYIYFLLSIKIFIFWKRTNAPFGLRLTSGYSQYKGLPLYLKISAHVLVIYSIKMTSFDYLFLNKAHLLNSECIRYFEIKFAQIKKKREKKKNLRRFFYPT